MTTDAWQSMLNGIGLDEAPPDHSAADHAREIYNHLVALSDELSAAYFGAFEKAAAGVGDLQRQVAAAGLPGWLEAGGGWQPGAPYGNVVEPFEKAAERALEFGEKLKESSKKVTLTYLDACEAAALAAADLEEEVAAGSTLELVRTVGGMHAEITREVTKACASTARDILS
jgi:hypothetical protein